MSHIEQLVGRQIELGEIRRRLQEEHRQPAARPAEETRAGPCIVVSREHGSDGARLARVVGERLGWKVFDREIVEEVARHAHVRDPLVRSIDEPTRSRWRFREIRPPPGEGLDRREYLYHLQQVILALGHLGSIILLGRGAQYLLPEPTTVRLRVVAPRIERVRRIAERDGLSFAEADHIVETIDAERVAFARNVFGRELTTAGDYDLVIQLGPVFFETATRLVLTLVRDKLGVDIPAAECVR